MKPTKLLSLILAVVMVLSLFAGCSSGKPMALAFSMIRS